MTSTVQSAPLELFDRLGRGDVLFIDSSHILMPGSDVDLLFNRILPRLPAGVIVHIHDIFLPFDYPPIWGWRAYNEQLGALPLLTTGAYVPLFSSVWAQQRFARPAGAVGGGAACLCRKRRYATSLWLQKRKAHDCGASRSALAAKRQAGHGRCLALSPFGAYVFCQS